MRRLVTMVMLGAFVIGWAVPAQALEDITVPKEIDVASPGGLDLPLPPPPPPPPPPPVKLTTKTFPVFPPMNVGSPPANFTLHAPKVKVLVINGIFSEGGDGHGNNTTTVEPPDLDHR